MVQYWESNWLNIESQIDSTLRVKLTQHWESNWLIHNPVTHFARLNYNFASDSTFKVKMTYYFSWCTERKIESFWPKKLWHLSWDKNIWIEKKYIYIYIYIYIVLITQSVTGKRGNLVLLLKLLISKIHQNYCDINYILKILKMILK